MGATGGHSRTRTILLGALLGVASAGPPRDAIAQDTGQPPYPHGSWQGECSLCHNQEKWVPPVISKQFDHSKYYALRGAHRAVPCRACHVTLEFSKAGRSCVECHQDVHRGEMGTDCERCHTPTSFIDRSEAVRMHRTTRFPLSGAHAAADCEACHRTRSLGRMMYVGLPIQCAACHDSTAFPAAPQRPADHIPNGFVGDCSLCHSTVSFATAASPHSDSYFPLKGGHALPCVDCHGQPFHSIPSPACANCHLAQYNATTDPNHAQAQFPTDCSLCHTIYAWTPSTFHHSATFPLTGAHATIDCNACHADGVYRGKPTACVSCHLAQYQSTTDPNHVQLNFPTDCTLCHDTTTWSNSTFNHQTTAFPLTGAHVALPCSACHSDGVYQGKPTTCVSCHQADVNAVTDPNHSAAGFSTDCSQCHNTTTFAGAQYAAHDASFFPIYSGRHSGLWTHCSDCHTSSSNYAVFSCITGACHPQAETDGNHTSVSGYTYDSAACYRCHPTGSTGGRRR